MNAIELPIIGCGSQPKEADGAALDFIHLPDSMTTFAMPKVSADLMAQPLTRAKALLQEVLATLNHYQTAENHSFSLQELNPEELAFINEVLGEGEVSIIHHIGLKTQIQESVLAGVWRVQGFNAEDSLIFDFIETGDMPRLIKEHSFDGAAKKINWDSSNLPDGLMNALPLLSELNAKIEAFKPDALAHVINLSLLPQTEQDLAFLDKVLGRGQVSILSRSYGTNRITSTATDKVWWVQYFNSDDTLILNTLEVSQVPSVACAAPEDLDDSATRLKEILAAVAV